MESTRHSRSGSITAAAPTAVTANTALTAGTALTAAPPARAGPRWRRRGGSGRSRRSRSRRRSAPVTRSPALPVPLLFFLGGRAMAEARPSGDRRGQLRAASCSSAGSRPPPFPVTHGRPLSPHARHTPPGVAWTPPACCRCPPGSAIPRTCPTLSAIWWRRPSSEL